MLMVEVNALKIAVKTDSLKVGYKDSQRPSGTLVAWVPTALRDALLEDKYIYYYDSDSDKEIQLLEVILLEVHAMLIFHGQFLFDLEAQIDLLRQLSKVGSYNVIKS